jgi:hypothetical protein
MIADIRTLPPGGSYPSARAVLEAHLEFVAQQFSAPSDAASRPLAGEVARALRAEGTDQVEAVEAAQPFVTVAATLGELELLPLAQSETSTAPKVSITNQT